LIVHWAALIAFEPSIPPPAKRQRVGNQIDAAMISYGVTFSAPAAPMVMFRML